MPELTFRRPLIDDIQEVLKLANACEVAEYGQPDSDLKEIKHEWAQVDLEQDAWLAVGPKGRLAGYAIVLPWGEDIRYLNYVDPTWPGDNLSRELLALCDGRGPKFASDRGLTEGIEVTMHIAHVDSRGLQVAQAAGFAPGQYYFQMRIHLDVPIPEPHWPEGVALRTFTPGKDDRAVYQLIQDAFARPGRKASTYEFWQEHMLRPDIYESDLWFLAVAGKDIVGACLCFGYPSGGWVRQLGVWQAWRRKGIGAALLRQAFIEFTRRDFTSVGLSVESSRPDAQEFYENVGMESSRRYDEYLKPLA